MWDKNSEALSKTFSNGMWTKVHYRHLELEQLICIPRDLKSNLFTRVVAATNMPWCLLTAVPNNEKPFPQKHSKVPVSFRVYKPFHFVFVILFRCCCTHGIIT